MLAIAFDSDALMTDSQKVLMLGYPQPAPRPEGPFMELRNKISYKIVQPVFDKTRLPPAGRTAFSPSRQHDEAEARAAVLSFAAWPTSACSVTSCKRWSCCALAARLLDSGKSGDGIGKASPKVAVPSSLVSVW